MRSVEEQRLVGRLKHCQTERLAAVKQASDVVRQGGGGDSRQKVVIVGLRATMRFNRGQMQQRMRDLG